MQVNDSERCKMMQEERNMKKMWKKVQEKFAGSEKVPTFAIPLENKTPVKFSTTAKMSEIMGNGEIR